VVREVLEANGIGTHVPTANAVTILPHLIFALNPKGVHVMVLPEDLADARKTIESVEPLPEEPIPVREDRPLQATPAEQRELTADDYARIAFRLSVLGIFFVGVGLPAPYYFVRAVCTERAEPGNRSRWYGWHILVAGIVSAGIIAGRLFFTTAMIAAIPSIQPGW